MKKCARSKAKAGSGGVASSPSRPPNGILGSAMRLVRRSDRPTGRRIRRVSKPGQPRNDWRLADRVCPSIHRHRNGFPVFYKIARPPAGRHNPKVAVPGEFELRPVALDRSRHENSSAPTVSTIKRRRLLFPSTFVRRTANGGQIRFCRLLPHIQNAIAMKTMTPGAINTGAGTGTISQRRATHIAMVRKRTPIL